MAIPHAPHRRSAGDGDDDRAQVRRLKAASVLEGTTLLVLLLIAVPLKHLGIWPLGVQVMGPLHGLTFVAYLWLIMQTASSAQWPRRGVIRMMLLAIVPFGGYLNARFLTRGIDRPVADRRP